MITILQRHGQMNGQTDDFAVAIPRSALHCMVKTAACILSINKSNDSFSAKDMPLDMRKFIFNIKLMYSKI